MKKNPFIGKWCIIEMDAWDSDYINEEEEGYFKFQKSGLGDFHFGNVHGSMDCEIEIVEGNQRIEFSWDGSAEMDEVTGRGWAQIGRDGILFGKIVFHMGDRSWFKAKRKK
jgi:uncharacterized protein YndB with AHSA1/START domain